MPKTVLRMLLVKSRQQLKLKEAGKASSLLHLWAGRGFCVWITLSSSLRREGVIATIESPWYAGCTDRTLAPPKKVAEMPLLNRKPYQGDASLPEGLKEGEEVG